MERLLKILAVCVLLACVAPAMAVDYYMQSGQGLNAATTNWVTGTYNPTPDATAEATWLTDSWTAPFGGWSPAPYYEFSDAVNPGPSSTDTVRFQEAWSHFTGAYTFTNGKTILGDTYYPGGYAAYGNLQWNFGIEVTGANWTMDTLQYGRNVDEKPFATQAGDGWGGYPWESYAQSSTMRVKNGTMNIGDIRVTNTNTELSMNFTSGSWGITRNEIKTQLGNASFGPTTNINIGNIYANGTPVVLKHTGGTISITGDILLNDGATEGNVIIAIIDNVDDGLDGIDDPILNIKMTELMKVINAQQMYAGDGISTSWNGIDDNAIRLDSWNSGSLVQVTAANMYDLFYIRDLGDGMVEVQRIPEPATLTLLGLGCVALVRRKRQS